MGMPGGGGGHPGGPGSEGRPNEEEMKRLRELMRELLEPSTRLTIVVKSGEVAITDALGRTQRFATNGTKEKHQLNAGTIETKTRWNGNQLVKDVSASGGMKVVETYAVDAATGQLNVTIRFEGGRGPDEPMKRVYDPALEEK
jgi:hypothetical protein